MGLTATFLALIHAIQNHRWIWVGTVILSGFIGAGSWIGIIYLGLFWVQSEQFFSLNKEESQTDVSADRWRRIRSLEKNVKSAQWVNDLEELSDLLESENRLSSAEMYAVEALKLDPENADLRIRLGRILYKRQKYSEASKAIEPVVATAGNNKEVMYLHAQILEKMGNLEASLNIWSSLARLNENPYELFQTARIYCRLEDEDSALPILIRLKSMRPLDAAFGKLALEDLHWIKQGKAMLNDIK